MASVLSVVRTAMASRIPDHCEPASPFLSGVSSVLGSCVPTPLAFTSTLLGTLSIIAWLFAQLPQIIKNYKFQSTSGLSIFFLVEWCLGDMSNLSGAILTHQATWQIIIGAYYCFVDLMLVGQWVWYEHLKHGRPLKSIWMRPARSRPSSPSSPNGNMQQVIIQGISPNDTVHLSDSQHILPQSQPADKHYSDSISKSPSSSHLFKDPIYSASPSTPPHSHAIPAGRPTANIALARSKTRFPKNPLPSPSPRTVLFVSLLLALTSRGLASPVTHTTSSSIITTANTTFLDTLGTILSWLSTTLYLGSRLPQLLKNARLRSTSGLSPLLFAAAFAGNLFYSTSLLTNPRAWHDFPAYGERGWVRDAPSSSADYVTSSLPFFLGAAGVLLMDAAVGVQFILYGGRGERVIVVVSEDTSPDETHTSGSGNGGSVLREGEVRGSEREDVLIGSGGRKWRRVSGWMRGWQPSAGVGGAITPVRRNSFEGERRALLTDGPARDGERGGSRGGYGAVV